MWIRTPLLLSPSWVYVARETHYQDHKDANLASGVGCDLIVLLMVCKQKPFILRWVDHSQLKFIEVIGIDFKPNSILENIGPYEITRRFREDQWLT